MPPAPVAPSQRLSPGGAAPAGGRRAAQVARGRVGRGEHPSGRSLSVVGVLPETPAGWTLRLVDLLGARLDQITEQHLETLVSGGVREDADLDFKEVGYGKTDQQRRALAGDLAAMGNGRAA